MLINRYRMVKSILIPIFLLLSAPIHASVTLLVHGWAADADTWLHSGVMQILVQKSQASDQGVLSASPIGVRHYPSPFAVSSNSEHHIYRAALLAEAPLPIQSEQLKAQIRYLQQRHPRKKISIVAHSAGGLVARMAITGPSPVEINRLITIATPHLGTPRAIDGIDVIESKPFFCPGPGINMAKSFFGGSSYDYLDNSLPLLYELAPPIPGSLIDALNRRSHPDIEYHALIRSLSGDSIVPVISQDMNRVPPLRGRVTLHSSGGGHSLHPADGEILAQILVSK